MQFVLSHSKTLGTLEMPNAWRRLDAAVHGARALDPMTGPSTGVQLALCDLYCMESERHCSLRFKKTTGDPYTTSRLFDNYDLDVHAYRTSLSMNSLRDQHALGPCISKH